MAGESKRNVVREPKWGYYPTLKDRVIEVEHLPEVQRPYQKGRAYAVFLDGERIGIVFATTETWERRTPGARYVNARGQKPAWQYEPEGWGQSLRTYHHKKDTRASAAFDLAEEYLREKAS